MHHTRGAVQGYVVEPCANELLGACCSTPLPGAEWPVDWLSSSARTAAKCLTRSGLNTNNASPAATTLKVIAISKTTCQPLDAAIPAAIGTSRAPVPLAVYSMPAFAAAYLPPKVSPWVAGNRL